MSRTYHLPTDSLDQSKVDILGVIEELPEELKPTQAEKDHLESCVKWKMCTVAFPIGVLSGLVGFLAVVNGKLLHPRYGGGPAVIGTGFLATGCAGYLVQEMCLKETIAKFPEGNGRLLRPDLDPNNISAMAK